MHKSSKIYKWTINNVTILVKFIWYIRLFKNRRGEKEEVWTIIINETLPCLYQESLNAEQKNDECAHGIWFSSLYLTRSRSVNGQWDLWHPFLISNTLLTSTLSLLYFTWESNFLCYCVIFIANFRNITHRRYTCRLITTVSIKTYVNTVNIMLILVIHYYTWKCLPKLL